MKIEQMQENAQAASRLLKSLANPHRLMILCHLVRGEHAVGELEELVGLGQSALSQHLARLREEGIVSCRREAQKVYYSLKDDKAASVLQALYGLYCSNGGD